MSKTIDKTEYLSMYEAAKLCPYAQDYLSLLCRRGEMRGVKVGKKWHTTEVWINEYLAKMNNGEKSKGFQIEKKVVKEKKEEERQNLIKIEKIFKFNFLLITLIIVSLVVAFYFVFQRIEDKKNNDQENREFIPEEILKLPNDQGGYDTFQRGSIKMEEEKN